MTPPHPPPLPQERLRPTGLEVVAPVFPLVAKVCGHWTAQGFFWIAAASETALILASVHPTWLFSVRVIELLLHPTLPLSSISNIRINATYLAGWFLVLTGALVRKTCYRIMGNQFTFELGIRQDHKLITTGPYSVVRHPSYTGALFAAVGSVVCHFTSGSWLMECSGYVPKTWRFYLSLVMVGVGVASSALGTRMRKEDEMLKGTFGEEWVRWVAKVPYRILPGIY